MATQAEKKAQAKAEADAKAKALQDGANNGTGVAPVVGEGEGDGAKNLGDVFGGQVNTNNVDPLRGVVQNTNTQSVPAPKEEGNVTLSRAQFDAIMNRINNNELNTAPAPKANIINPLAEVKGNRIARVAYWGSDLVVGYKGTVRPDGRQTFVFKRKNAQTGEMRETLILLLEDAETLKIKELEIDFVEFLNGLVTIDATIKSQQDIGKIVEQGSVQVMIWDGRQMTGSGQSVMSGAKEQRFVFTMDINGKEYTMPQEVINIL